VKHVVLVCGGRDYDNFAEVSKALHREKPTKVVTGESWVGREEAHVRRSPGADRLAYLWCLERDCPYQGYPADWRNFGLAAGPMRNTQMLAAEQVDVVLAFPGGRGTADMVRKAKSKGIPVRFVPTALSDATS
jgi:hypothetical protein